jgi:hypothetical protein
MLIRLGLSVLPDQKPSRARQKTAAGPVHIPLPEMPPPGQSETQYTEPENNLIPIA